MPDWVGFKERGTVGHSSLLIPTVQSRVKQILKQICIPSILLATGMLWR